MSSQALANPYVGPRSFLPGERLYGRDRELRDLFGLLVAERIVLLHSPSGAGKTSLIQAALVPRLLESDFAVLPVVRVGLEPPADMPSAAQQRPLAAVPAGRRAYEGETPSRSRAARPAAPNRYTLSTLISLSAEAPADDTHVLADLLDLDGAADEPPPLADLAGLSLAAYLDSRDRDRGKVDTVLIFDQFEEVLTVDPLNVAAKLEFFTQLGEALRDRRRWALFAMREDYVAALAPYLRPVPTRLSNTFRLDLLDPAGALAAIREPAEHSGVDFTPAAATALVDDLRKAKVQIADGSIVEQLGPGVEPVQLQVVCYRLWQRLFGPGAAPPEGSPRPHIDPADLQGVADVDGSLAEYYAERVAAAAGESGVSERAVREWVDRKLITPLNIRGQVLRGAAASEGLPNAAIAPLIDAYLVRVEQRRGMAWLELAHDRLVGPVRANNAAWFAANLSPLQRQADLWDQQGRPRSLLFRDADLAAAEAWAAANAAEVNEAEVAFLADCRELRAAAERERRQNQRIRLLAWVASGVALIALVALVVAVRSYFQAAEQQRISRARELSAAARTNLPTDPELSVLLAIQAADATRPEDDQVAEAQDALQQSVQASRVRRSFTLADEPQFITRSPDGRLLAVATRGADVGIYDAVTSQQVGALPGHPKGAWRVIYSRDGALMATAGLDFQIRVWDAATRQLVWPVLSHDKLNDVAFSPDGRLLASGGGDVAIIWDAAGTPLHTLSHGAFVNSVAFVDEGRTLVSAGHDGVLRLWDVRSGAPRGALEPREPAGRLFAVTSNQRGDLILAGSNDTNAYLWSLATGELLHTLRGHVNTIGSVAISPDGGLLATASTDGTAKIWSADTGEELLTLTGHQGRVRGVAFSPDTGEISTSSTDKTARTWDIGPMHSGDVEALAESPDGQSFASGGNDGIVAVWATDTGRLIRRLRGHQDDISAVAYSPDGARLASTSYDGEAIVWDLADGAPALRIATDSELEEVAFGPGGDWIVTAGTDYHLVQWDAADGRQLRAFNDAALFADPNLKKSLRGVAVSPDGALLAAVYESGAAVVYDVAGGATRQVVVPPTADSPPLTAVAFSPDGATLAFGGDNGTAVLWDLAGQSARFSLVGHTNKVAAIAFSRDGTKVATTSLDKTTRIWQLADGALLRTIAHPVGNYGVVFTSAADSVVTAGTDGVLRTSLLDLKALRDLAIGRVTRPFTPAECDQYHLNDICPPNPEGAR